MAEYGLPYQGSKGRLIERFAHLFPNADHFYDLFGGGFSVTHYMIQRRSKHFKHFHFNEIRPGICELIQKAIRGEFAYDNFKVPWVSREEFFAKKEQDPFIKIIWSFGNGGKNYLFGQDIEDKKRSLHMAVVFGQFDEFAKYICGLDQWPKHIPITGRRLFVRNRVMYLKKKSGLTRGDLVQLERLQQLEQLERLEQLQQLERLQQLEQLKRLNFYTGDYKSVAILPNSVIYCDIPYAGTAEYDNNANFNHKEFFNWADSQKCPVLISEYNVSDPKFRLLLEFKAHVLMSSKGVTKNTERIYGNAAACAITK